MLILITKDESDLYLSAYTDWVALSDGDKDAHIKKASAYTQSKWSMPDTAWADVATTDDVKEAVSHYAYASFIGNLFGDISSQDTKSIRREMKKLGSMSSDIEYLNSSGSSQYTTYTGYPDTLMRLSGFEDSQLDTLLRT